MEKIITCEISFIPIGNSDYENEINRVIDIIRSFGIECHTGLLSTTVRGGKEEIFNMLRQIFDESEKRTKFTMTIKLSNECGCTKKV